MIPIPRAHPLAHPRCISIGELRIWIIPLRSDNYSYFIQRQDDPVGWVVDPSEDDPLIAFFNDHKFIPKYVLLTHHHDDHIHGAVALRSHFKCQLVGAKSERARLPPLDIELNDDATFALECSQFGFQFQTIPCPGHTFHHVSFFLPRHNLLFCGDVLFGLGCGRVFEGTMQEMHQTLQRLCDLAKAENADISIFCGHEYTRSNLNVWKNLGILKQLDPVVVRLEDSSDPCTVPLSMKQEIEWNPLLTVDFTLFSERRKLRNQF